ncbi:MAG: AAA family ATPase [Smithellaceae bacterium]
MDYYNLLHFKKEPFSNSPEPEFLFASPQHSECLQMLELAVRLRRGLNIVIGDVGTGKTTLCRKLIQNLSVLSASDSPDIETHLLLDPALGGKMGFLRAVHTLLCDAESSESDTEWQLKEKIKNGLFRKGVEEEKIVALIIDEGQKLPSECLEILREFLNYETNSFKLLQIVIFAQREIEKTLSAHPNLLDRVNVLYRLKPLTFRQTRDMIHYRVRVARESELIQNGLFSFGGLLAVYLATGGYPRKIVSLCHQVLLKMIIRGSHKAGFFFVLACAGPGAGSVVRKIQWAALLVVLIAAAGIFAFSFSERKDAGVTPEAQAAIAEEKGIVEPLSEEARLPSGPVAHSNMKMPEMLGEITFQKNMTLWRVLESIYGYAGPELIGKVVEANPHIMDVDLISEGGQIRLPAIATRRPHNRNFWVVAIQNSADLGSAYDRYRDELQTVSGNQTMIFSYWSADKGFNHAVALNRVFKDAREASEAVAVLPSGLDAKILSGWTPETVFFNRVVESSKRDRRSDEI